MLGRIFAVAENAWVELVKKKALYFLLATVVLTFIMPVTLQYRWMLSSGAGARALQSLRESIFALDKFILLAGLGASILLAAGGVESEVSRRTLCSVMIRPIHRWEYLAGRALGVTLLFFCFAFAAVLCSYGAALFAGAPMPATFLWGVLQRVFAGAAWIVIALSLAAITSSATSITVIVALGILSAFVPYLPNDLHWMIPVVKEWLHYATPCAWKTNFFARTAIGIKSPVLREDAAIALENIMYAATVFIVCSLIFTKRDLKLRE